MITIYEKNNYIYIHGIDEELEWCDAKDEKDGSVTNYFPLNIVTRECFKKEILPEVRNNNVRISQELFDKIRTFKQNPKKRDVLEIGLDTTVPNIILEPHQVKALQLMLEYDKYAFFYGPGTGKTLIAIAWIIKTMPKSCLIVTPAKVVGQYKKELEKYIPGNNYKVTNFEQLHKEVSVERDKKRRAYSTTVINKYDAIIIDESHKVKNYSSDANIKLRELAKYATNIYLFTGSPQDKSRHDILSQLAILDPRLIPVKTKIFERYFTLDDFYEPKREHRNRKRELTEIIKQYAIAEKTENVVELTKSNFYLLRCDKPIKYYDTLLVDRCIDIDEEHECIADTATLLRIMLKEVCCGMLKIKNIRTKVESWLTFESTKDKQLERLTNHIPNGIIYYEFTNSVTNITNVLDKTNRTYVVVNGSTRAKSSHTKIED